MFNETQGFCLSIESPVNTKFTLQRILEVKTLNCVLIFCTENVQLAELNVNWMSFNTATLVEPI